jgi:hypothetical protein
MMALWNVVLSLPTHKEDKRMSQEKMQKATRVFSLHKKMQTTLCRVCKNRQLMALRAEPTTTILAYRRLKTKIKIKARRKQLTEYCLWIIK